MLFLFQILIYTTSNDKSHDKTTGDKKRTNRKRPGWREHTSNLYPYLSTSPPKKDDKANTSDKNDNKEKSDD